MLKWKKLTQICTPSNKECGWDDQTYYKNLAKWQQVLHLPENI